MKARRVLAAVLCAAMIFTSETFSLGVMAAPAEQNTAMETVTESPKPDDGAEAIETPTATAEPTPEATEAPTEAPTPEAPAVTETPEPTETPGAIETPDAGESPVPSQIPETSATPGQTPEVSPLPEESASPETTPSALPGESSSPSPSQTPSALPDETATPEFSPTPSNSPETSVSPTPSTSPELDIMMMDIRDYARISSDYFEVIDGILTLKDGAHMASTVYIPDEAVTIPSGIFTGNGEVSIIRFSENSQLTTIEAGAFKGSAVTEISIPAGVTEIKEDTFKNSRLKTITFLGNVTSIGEEAFMNTRLIKFVAPGSLTTIGEGAFSACSDLREVDLVNLQQIGARAFQNCKLLNDSNIGWSRKLTKIGAYAFQGCGFTNLSMLEVNADADAPIVIESGVFADCANLTTVRLPENIQSISNNLFQNCKALKHVYLSEQVESIESYAFQGCTALEAIELPAKVSSIKALAFAECINLTTITIYQRNESLKPAATDLYIAENAFPAKSGVTMRGYDGTVQEYAEKKEYKFETLNQKYSVIVSSNFSQYAKLTVPANTLPAVAGTEILVTVVPNSGYCLKEGTIQALGSYDTELTLVSCVNNNQVFSFIMPEKDIKIDAEFEPTKEAGEGNLTYSLAKMNNQPISVDYEKNEAVMAKTGQQAKLVVSGNQTIGAWLLNFRSSNTAVATISNTGVISAKGKGTATITATMKNNSTRKISFKLSVEQDALITDLELDFGNPSRAKIKEMTVEENGESKTYTVVEYSKATLKAGPQSFKVSMKAMDEGGTGRNLIVNSKWTAIDRGIAGVAQSTSSDNTNIIKVNKGVEGETMITVSVTNKDEAKTVCEESFVVRIVDATPRLADAAISVNVLSEVGTAVDIVPVYGYEINPEVSLTLCKKNVVNGIVDYDEIYSGLEVVYDNTEGNYRIVATDTQGLAAGRSKTFSGSTQLFIRGELEEEGGTFIIPVPKLTIINKALAPSVTLKGRINLFYNSTAPAEEQGSVQVTQNLKNEKVTGYELVSDANHKKPGSEYPDSFDANFDIDENGLITRSDAENMAQVNGRNVVAGYLYISYEGYNEPVKKRITISTYNTAPSYVLSQTTATASEYKENQTYELKLLDRKTKEEIDLGNLDAVDGLSFDYSNTGTTRELFQELNLQDAITNKYIELIVDGTPSAGKAVMNVKMSTWSKPLKYTFNLRTTASLPTLKLSSTTATLNNLCRSQSVDLTATLNQTDAKLVGFDEASLTYTGSKTYTGEAEKLAIDLQEDRINISLPQGENVRNGRYSFRVRPVVRYEDGGREYKLNYVTFYVAVNGNMPAVRFKSNILRLNALNPGVETVATTYTMTNLPVGSTYTVDSSNVTFTPVVKNSIAAEDMLENINLTFDGNDTISAQLAEDGIYAKNFDYSYYVNGLKIQLTGEQEAIELAPFKVRVIGRRLTPSVSVTAKGTINPVDADSNIVYTGKVRNIVSDISDISIQELNLTDGKNNYYLDEYGKPTSKHFTLERDGNAVIVRAKDGEVLKSGASYKIQLVYRLDAVPNKKYTTSDLTIRPRQSLPRIKTDKTSAYLYAGQNRPKEVDVAITKTSLTGAEIEDVVFAKNTPAAIKRAFRVEYDEATGVMTLKLVNPSMILLNRAQSITFETKCKNQMTNTTGTTFRMSVTVRK